MFDIAESERAVDFRNGFIMRGIIREFKQIIVEGWLIVLIIAIESKLSFILAKEL